MSEPTMLIETTGRLVESESGSAHALIQIIEGDRWGSSGYYPAEVLERDGPAAFGPGTHMYINHPTITEDAERPERDVRDLVGVLEEGARFEDGALVGEATIFTPFREALPELAPHIGVSIRAGGILEEGERDGRRGPIVTSIAESNGAHSVDFVTRAGAGGRVLSLLESARPLALHEAHGMMANDLRDALSHAVREEHGGENVYIWVRDYDDDSVIYDRDTDGDSGTFRQAYTVTDDQVALAGDPVEGQMHSEFRPFGTTQTQESSTPTTSQEDAMPDTPETELRESVTTLQGQVTQLTESVNTLTAERDTALTEVAQLRARDTARGRIAEALTADAEPLPPTSQTRITEAVLANVPLTDAGELDTDALTEAITAAATVEREYVASLLEAAGVGRVRGLGSTGAGGDVSDDEFEGALAEAFGRPVITRN